MEFNEVRDLFVEKAGITKELAEGILEKMIELGMLSQPKAGWVKNIWE